MSPIDWDAEEAELRQAVEAELVQAARLGGDALRQKVAAMAGGSGMAVAWDQANEAAGAWAREYVGTLIQGITQTTRDNVARAVGAYHDTPGMTRGQLERLILDGGVDDLVTGRGIIPADVRAGWIAVTETTRSYSEGEVAALEASGLEQVSPTQRPPAHVGCRCDISPFMRDDGVMSWQWQTLNDGQVCAICAPLHARDVGEKGR